MAVLRTFLWNSPTRADKLGSSTVVQLGASVSSLYLAQLVPRMAVIEWRQPLCQWLNDVVTQSSGRLHSLEVVCVPAKPSVGTQSGGADSTQVLQALDTCCSSFKARDARILEVSGLAQHAPARQQVLRHVASLVSPAPTYVAMGGWSGVEADLNGISLDRVVGVGSSSATHTGELEAYGYMVLAKRPYTNKHHAEFAKHQPVVQVNAAGSPLRAA